MLTPENNKIALQRIIRNERGATATEYAVIIVGIILTVLAAIIFLQKELIALFALLGVNIGNFGTIN